MAYKDPIVAARQKKVFAAMKKLRFYRSMGLEPRDVNNPKSDLECRHCFKITHRACPHMFRHERWCPYYSETMEILGNPRTFWSRKSVKCQ